MSLDWTLIWYWYNNTNMTYLDKFWPIITNFDKFWPILTSLIQFIKVWPHMTLKVLKWSELISGNEWQWLLMREKVRNKKSNPKMEASFASALIKTTLLLSYLLNRLSSCNSNIDSFSFFHWLLCRLDWVKLDLESHLLRRWPRPFPPLLTHFSAKDTKK